MLEAHALSGDGPPGYDFAGVVESVGSKVTGLKVGERVTAISWRSDKPGSENDSHGGTFAEYLSIPAYKLSIIPPDVSDQEAAALVLVGPTAFQALFHLIKLPPNSRVLILGGSSAVGAVAIQLAKQKGSNDAFHISSEQERKMRFVFKLI